MRLFLIEGLAIIAVSVVGIVDGYLAQSRQQFQHEVLNPGLYLVVISAALLVLTVLYLVTGIRSGKVGQAAAANSSGDSAEDTSRVGIKVWGVLVGYALLIPILGYALTTLLFFVAVLYLLGVRPWLRMSVIALSLTLFFYLVFVQFANILMPTGFVGQILPF